jgi:putative PEP-CTERM system TPR-repeat lipoprotein
MLSPMHEEHSRDGSLLGLLAESQFQTGDYKAARSSLTELAALGPMNSRAHIRLAESNHRLGNAADAAEELKKVLDLDNDNVQARLLLTRYQIANKSLEEATDNVRILKEQTKNSPEALILEGQLAEAKGELVKAEDAYQQAFKSQRTNLNLLHLTNVEWQLGKREEAIKVLKEWLKEYPKDNLTQLELANRYLSLGKNPEAIQAFKKVIEAAPNMVLALNNLAWLLKDSNPSEALQYAEKARVVAPNAPAVMDTTALVLLSNGQAQKAEATINRALDIEPNNPTFTYHKAMILEASGRGNEALPLLERIVNNNQKFAERDAAQQMLEKVTTEDKNRKK